jgi:hypothetical protein
VTAAAPLKLLTGPMSVALAELQSCNAAGGRWKPSETKACFPKSPILGNYTFRIFAFLGIGAIIADPATDARLLVA